MKTNDGRPRQVTHISRPIGCVAPASCWRFFGEVTNEEEPAGRRRYEAKSGAAKKKPPRGSLGGGFVDET
jgi:hypothetical protein